MDVDGLVLAREAEDLEEQIKALPWVVPPKESVLFDRNKRSMKWNPRNAGAIVSLKCTAVCGKSQLDQKGSSTCVTPLAGQLLKHGCLRSCMRNSSGIILKQLLSTSV